jgi:[histone H3]-trimethyl-L-lysine9/36 demethylase
MGGSAGDPNFCPVLRPTRHEFSKPFMQYVEEAFKAHPGAPMLKVVPPKGWTPRTAAFPNLDDIRISTPIKQHVSVAHMHSMLGDVV